MENRGDNEIGALWQNFSKNGNIYESGHIELNGKKYKIKVYDNKYHKGKKPDKLIYLYGEEDKNDIKN